MPVSSLKYPLGLGWNAGNIRPIDSKSYIQTGLVAHYDGIDNGGYGIHTTSTKITDVSRNCGSLASATSVTANSYKLTAQGTSPRFYASSWTPIYQAITSYNFSIEWLGVPNATNNNNYSTLLHAPLLYNAEGNAAGEIRLRFCFKNTEASYRKILLMVRAPNQTEEEALKITGVTDPEMPEMYTSYGSLKRFVVTVSTDPETNTRHISFVTRTASYECDKEIVSEPLWPATPSKGVYSDARRIFFGGSATSLDEPISSTSALPIGQRLYGTWHCLRIYSRALGKDEIKYNEYIDKKRFEV